MSEVFVPATGALIGAAIYDVPKGGQGGVNGAWADPTVIIGAPEPSTWTMMFLGFLGLGVLASRRGRKARLATI